MGRFLIGLCLLVIVGVVARLIRRGRYEREKNQAVAEVQARQLLGDKWDSLSAKDKKKATDAMRE